jgi:hypothetical protein
VKFLWDLGWDTYRYTKRPAMSGGEGEKTDMIEEEEDMMLRQLKRQKTHATINTDHLDLHEKVVPSIPSYQVPPTEVGYIGRSRC